jgi:hypothetical protein
MNTPKSEILLLLSYLTPSITDCVILFDDNTFKKGAIINDTYNSIDNLMLVQNSHKDGAWEQIENDILINFNDGTVQYLMYNKSAGYYSIKNGNKRTFYYASANLKLINLAMPLLNEREMMNETA